MPERRVTVDAGSQADELPPSERVPDPGAAHACLLGLLQAEHQPDGEHGRKACRLRDQPCCRRPQPLPCGTLDGSTIRANRASLRPAGVPGQTSSKGTEGSPSRSGSSTRPDCTSSSSGATPSSQRLTCMAATDRPSCSQNAWNSRPRTSPRVTTRSYPLGGAWPTYSMPRSYWSVKKNGSSS